MCADFGCYGGCWDAVEGCGVCEGEGDIGAAVGLAPTPGASNCIGCWV